MSANAASTVSQGAHRPPWLSGLLVLLATGLWLQWGPAPDALVYHRAALAQGEWWHGEWWRWVSGHLVHSDGAHALWDIAALALIGPLVERQGRLRLALATGAGLAAVSLGLWWYLPWLERYCGLSGVLNTLFVVALADLWRTRRHPVVPLVALGLAAKLAVETLAGQSLFVSTQWPSVPQAHVAGCLGGLGFLAVEWAVERGVRWLMAPGGEAASGQSRALPGPSYLR